MAGFHFIDSPAPVLIGLLADRTRPLHQSSERHELHRTRQQAVVEETFESISRLLERTSNPTRCL